MIRDGRRVRTSCALGMLFGCVIAYGAVALGVQYSGFVIVEETTGVGVGRRGALVVAAATTVSTGSLVCAWALRTGPKLLLAAVDVPLHDVPADSTLSGRVEEHATLLDVEPPEMKLAATEQPFAVTISRDRRTETMIVSQGLLDLLPTTELDAVLLHELAHVARRDTRMRTLLSIPVVIARRWHGIGAGYWQRATATEIDAPSTERSKYVGPVSATVFLALFVASHPLAVVCRWLLDRRAITDDLAADRTAAASTGIDPVVNAIAHIEDERGSRSLTSSLTDPTLAGFAFVPVTSDEAETGAHQADKPRGRAAQDRPRSPDHVTELRRRTLEVSRE